MAERMRTARKFILTVLCMLSLVSAVSVASAESISTIESNASYHARRSFGTGLYDSTANKTFVTYSGPQMDVYVKAYNHATASWEPAVKVYDWDDSSTYAYHDYPTMVLLPDGKLGIFINNHATAAYLIKAPNTHSISGTWVRTQISSDLNAYPMPVISGSTIYYFYSKNNDQSYPYRTYRYIKSTDSGATWSSPLTVIDTQKTNGQFDEVYAYGVAEKNGKIYITWSMSGGSGGHDHSSRHLYLAYLNTTDGAMYNVAGTTAGNVINTSDLASCLVTEAQPLTTSSVYNDRHPISNSAPSVAGDGTVVVGFGQQNTDGSGTKTIKLASFLNGAWSFQTVDTAASGFMDLVKSGSGAQQFDILYSASQATVLVSKQTTNLGSSWTNLYTFNVPFSSNADTMVYANFIENRQTVRVVGGTINTSERQTDYTGKWNLFAVHQ
ncbi:hypothetical protein FHS18_003592 [Paenibacillus phyllosphaerae]|uniref:BNR repeat-containing family member n=1 Tax=Paenibacillus phyllosphaerae TaxID=274593 RepID=A0A7W5FNZ6_9BACL|nr:BNR-4 repeat-containing protein [Paenibacillus phyllosphaerae]MBB3111524.1 hypothetical protein [Paenibacillus phyllosphaerae]